MLTNREVSALLEQAARNLETLELLARSASEEDPIAITPLRQRLHELKVAYTSETDALTHKVLEGAIWASRNVAAGRLGVPASRRPSVPPARRRDLVGQAAEPRSRRLGVLA